MSFAWYCCWRADIKGQISFHLDKKTRETTLLDGIGDFFFNALTVFDTVDWVTSGLSPHPQKVVFQNTWRKKTDGLPKSDLLGKWSRHILYDQRYSHDLVVISQSGHTSLKKVPIFPVPGSWKVLESRMGFEIFGILYERSGKVLWVLVLHGHDYNNNDRLTAFDPGQPG